MQNKVPIVSELPHFAREEGNSPSHTHPLLGSTILQILATPLMYSVEPWCVLWKCKITPINFCPLNRSDSRCLDLGIPMVYIRDDLLIHNPNTMWSATQTGDQYCLTILHHLSLSEYTDIRNHLSKEFAGMLGTRNNDRSQATGPPGFLLVVFRSGSDQAHGDMMPINAGIFKYS